MARNILKQSDIVQAAVGIGFAVGERGFPSKQATTRGAMMAVTEVERHSLVQGLIDTLGEERTEVLMKCILPEGLDQLATKQDVELVGERLRAEFGEKFGDLRAEFGEKFGELRAEFGELRAEFGELRAEFGELRAEFGELRAEFGELRAEFGELRGEVKEFKGYVDSALAKQTRIYLMAMIGFVIMVWASTLAPHFL
ncbi:MAG: hypothetical protein J4F50_10320 [Acidimicrobiia bacterium]|nr:hypothetical protein [Acidimicrobiia bacterium]